MSSDSEVLDGSLFGPDNRCFGCSVDHPFGFRLRLERDDEGVRTRFVPGEGHQGPPRLMHGGLVVTLADEVAAWAIIDGTGRFGFTTSLQARFVQGVRIGEEVQARGRILRKTRRTVKVEVDMSQGEREVFRGEFAFVLLDRSGAERLLGFELPEAWRQFARLD